jgi:hypothetical protein
VHEPDRRLSYVNQYPPGLNMSGTLSLAASNLPVRDHESQGNPSSRRSSHVDNFTSPIGMCFVIINVMIHCLLPYHRYFASDLAAMTNCLSGTTSFASSLYSTGGCMSRSHYKPLTRYLVLAYIYCIRPPKRRIKQPLVTRNGVCDPIPSLLLS